MQVLQINDDWSVDIFFAKNTNEISICYGSVGYRLTDGLFCAIVGSDNELREPDCSFCVCSSQTQLLHNKHSQNRAFIPSDVKRLNLIAPSLPIHHPSALGI